MNFVYPSYRPSLQRSPSDPQPVIVNNIKSNLFYPYKKNDKQPQRIGRFTIEPTKVNSTPSQKIGRFTIEPAKINSKQTQKIGRFTVTPAARGGNKKSRSKRKRRSVTRKSR